MFLSACFVAPCASTVGVQSSAFTTSCARSCSRKSLSTLVPRSAKRMRSIHMASDDSKPPAERNSGRTNPGMFGIRLQTNGDVIKFGIVAIVVVYAIKAFLQLLGTPDLLAGQLTTAFVSVLSLLAWVSTYVFRVGTKGMTYAQQLRDYEDEVIKKRYEELTEEELAALTEELDDDI